MGNSGSKPAKEDKHADKKPTEPAKKPHRKGPSLQIEPGYLPVSKWEKGKETYFCDERAGCDRSKIKAPPPTPTDKDAQQVQGDDQLPDEGITIIDVDENEGLHLPVKRSKLRLHPSDIEGLLTQGGARQLQFEDSLRKMGLGPRDLTSAQLEQVISAATQVPVNAANTIVSGNPTSHIPFLSSTNPVQNDFSAGFFVFAVVAFLVLCAWLVRQSSRRNKSGKKSRKARFSDKEMRFLGDVKFKEDASLIKNEEGLGEGALWV